MTAVDADVAAVQAVLRRVIFTPEGKPVGLAADRDATGAILLQAGPIHSVCSRTGKPRVGWPSLYLGGDPQREEDVLAEVALLVARTGAHDLLEWLRVDGELVHDPHLYGLDIRVPTRPVDRLNQTEPPWRYRDLVRIVRAAWRFHRKARSRHRHGKREVTNHRRSLGRARFTMRTPANERIGTTWRKRSRRSRSAPRA